MATLNEEELNRISEQLIEHFEATDSENYNEWHFSCNNGRDYYLLVGVRQGVRPVEKLALADQKIETLTTENELLRRQLKTCDSNLEKEIERRDNYHEWADKLAHAISAITGADIGEHSSGNNPWIAALEEAEIYQAQNDK